MLLYHTVQCWPGFSPRGLLRNHCGVGAKTVAAPAPFATTQRRPWVRDPDTPALRYMAGGRSRTTDEKQSREGECHCDDGGHNMKRPVFRGAWTWSMAVATRTTLCVQLWQGGASLGPSRSPLEKVSTMSGHYARIPGSQGRTVDVVTPRSHQQPALQVASMIHRSGGRKAGLFFLSIPPSLMTHVSACCVTPSDKDHPAHSSCLT